jgi:hypothetical protein
MGSKPSRGPRRPVARPVSLALTAAVLFAACGGSGYTFVGHSATQTAFKVPSDWTPFNKNQLLVGSGLESSPQTDQAFQFLVGFDSDPDPSVDHVLSGNVKYPVLLAWVRQLDPNDRDSFSLQSIRNAVYPVDQLIQTKQAEILSIDQDIVMDGGIRGAQIVYNMSPSDLNIGTGNQLFRINQIGLVDPGTNLFYLLVVRCQVDCYEQNERVIDVVMESYRVRER